MELNLPSYYPSQATFIAKTIKVCVGNRMIFIDELGIDMPNGSFNEILLIPLNIYSYTYFIIPSFPANAIVDWNLKAYSVKSYIIA